MQIRFLKTSKSSFRAAPHTTRLPQASKASFRATPHTDSASPRIRLLQASKTSFRATPHAYSASPSFQSVISSESEPLSTLLLVDLFDFRTTYDNDCNNAHDAHDQNSRLSTKFRRIATTHYSLHLCDSFIHTSHLLCGLCMYIHRSTLVHLYKCVPHCY